MARNQVGTDMASVTIADLKKTYGNVEVLHGINLDIEDGKFVVLLGPSGCGKSTLLRMIAGLESITSGDVKIAERRVNGVHPKDRNIAMVFQNYALYAHMKVRDNMAFSMNLKKMDKAKIDERVAWAAGILSLEPYLDRYPKELSGGQRQRVAMGRAIVRDPDVFLFDEPLSNLDAKLRVQMRTEIKELHQRLKTTTVYVTHDQIEAMTMADTVVIMRDGVIEQSGSPLDVYDNPRNLFVAQFIGSPGMNILEGIVKTAGGETALDIGGARVAVRDGLALQDGQAILLGVRPEHLSLSDTESDLKMVLSVAEPTGPETHLYGRIGGKEACVISRERRDWVPGETLHVTVDKQTSHIFDQQSETCLTSAP
ncbi:carbohydrate ABC transporter ATP-binding protein, CUT1 family [Roseobacter denitrificans OCh 114]|nr:carbohydrate ABC transporter ATP-binding protein, CUT1 family [Roseobacter denitrificans OCh 114]